MVDALHRQEHRIQKKGQEQFEKDFFNLMNNSMFEKTMENVRNHSCEIKLVKTDKKEISWHKGLTNTQQNTF